MHLGFVGVWLQMTGALGVLGDVVTNNWYIRGLWLHRVLWGGGYK